MGVGKPTKGASESLLDSSLTKTAFDSCGTTTAAPSILVVLLDFDCWASGRSWSYSASYSLLDGFKAQGCETVVLPSFNTGMTSAGPHQSNPWVDARDRIVGDRTFDQAWVWLTYSYYTEDFWKWLARVAPVRVGVLMESLTYSADECAQYSPLLAQRRAKLMAELRHVTHVLTLDECDVVDIEKTTGLPVRQYQSMLPPDLISDLDAPGGEHPVFLGKLYRKRRDFLAANPLDNPLVILSPPEDATDLAARFDATHRTFRQQLQRTGGYRELADSYVSRLRDIRRDALKMVFSAYRRGFVSVNLPALFKGFTGRVIETIASATPLITPRPGGRPFTEGQFVEGRDLLYYDPIRSGDLSRQVRRLAGDHALQNHLVQNARRTLRARMLSTTQIGECFDWIAMTRTIVREPQASARRYIKAQTTPRLSS